MAVMKASKLQARILGLLGKEFDGTYDMGARLLEEMGLPKNGAPEGHTARSAGKLSDDELLALLPEADTSAEVATHDEAKAQDDAYWTRVKREAKEAAQEREAERAERRKLNDALRAEGYRWVWLDEEARDAFGGNPWDEDRWALFGPDGKETAVEAAKAAIGWE